ncbi:MAG: hypothetical protein LBG12_09770 [Synergistaceae bacterium]|jgi:hypothetical protein|nr:hypothetical protein [Synergistaceae bacterium]
MFLPGFFFDFDQRRNQEVSTCYSDFQNGDLVFIRGRTWRSFFVRFFERTNDFSHVGIVRFVNDISCVIHATPEANAVRLDRIEDFSSPRKADSVAVYRLKVSPSFAEAASKEALSYFERGISFDHRFDTFNNDRLYCTELVWLAFKHAGIDLSERVVDFFYDSVLYGKVLLPERLSKNFRLEQLSLCNSMFCR